MKKLLTSTALLLIALAGVSYGQDVVICSPSALTGGPDIVAELGICPRGYMEVRRTANSSGNSSGGLFQRSVENMSDSIRRDNERRAAEREAARQRANERAIQERQIQAQQQQQRRINAALSEDSRCLQGTWDVANFNPEALISLDVAANGDVYLEGNNLSEQAAIEPNSTVSVLNNNIYMNINADEFRLRLNLRLSDDSLAGNLLLTRIEQRFFGDRELPTEERELLGTRVDQPPAGCELNIEPQPQSTNSSSPTVNRGETIADGLRNLSDLHRQGILTDEEFNAAKRRLLGL